MNGSHFQGFGGDHRDNSVGNLHGIKVNVIWFKSEERGDDGEGEYWKKETRVCEEGKDEDKKEDRPHQWEEAQPGALSTWKKEDQERVTGERES